MALQLVVGDTSLAACVMFWGDIFQLPTKSFIPPEDDLIEDLERNERNPLTPWSIGVAPNQTFRLFRRLPSSNDLRFTMTRSMEPLEARFVKGLKEDTKSESYCKDLITGFESLSKQKREKLIRDCHLIQLADTVVGIDYLRKECGEESWRDINWMINLCIELHKPSFLFDLWDCTWYKLENGALKSCCGYKLGGKNVFIGTAPIALNDTASETVREICYQAALQNSTTKV